MKGIIRSQYTKLTKSHLFERMVSMKLGIFLAILLWIGFSVSWGWEGVNDPKLLPPITKIDKKEVGEMLGKIELNIRPDGSVNGREGLVLKTDEEIKNYILKSKDEYNALGKKPILHFKGVVSPKLNTAMRLLVIADQLGINRMISSLEMGGVLKAEASDVPEKKSE
jgi:hypothetical protein